MLTDSVFGISRLQSSELRAQDDIPPTVDRGEIFETLLRRQALRREARLPLLKIGSEYRRLVELAAWKRHVAVHLDRVQAEILAERRARHGPAWPSSWGGQFAFAALVQKALRASFRKP